MREDTRATKVYRFEELSEEAQEKAMDKLWDINVDFFDWWDCTYDDANNIGVKIAEFDVYRWGSCHGTFTHNEWEVAETILQAHGKICKTYTDAYKFIWELADEEYEYRRWHDIADDDDFDEEKECPELLDEFRQTIFEDYRIILREEYEYLTSKEAIWEAIEANDYEFTRNGELYF